MSKQKQINAANVRRVTTNLSTLDLAFRLDGQENESIYQHQRKIMQHALDVLQMSSTDPKRYIERAIDILKTGLGE